MRTDALLAAGFVAMWSSGFVGAVLGTEHAGAFTLLLWRFLVVAAVLWAWWLVARRRIPARAIGVHAVIGLLSQCGYLFGVVYSAELGVPAGVAALVAALQPIAAAALSGPLLGERTSRLQWVGLAVGLGGVALVVGDDLTSTSAASPLAYALPFLAMAALVAGTFAERSARVPALPLSDALLVQCTTSAVVFTGLAAATGQARLPTEGGFWLAVAWVVVLSTFGGYGCYWLVVRRGSVNRASVLLYLTPPATMLMAYAMFGDTITAGGLLGLLVCAIAVLLATRPPRSRRELSVPRAMMAECCSTTSSPRPRVSPRRDRGRPRSPCSPSS